MASTPSIGVVGLGGMGTHHAKTLERVGATIVAGVDIDEEARETFTEAFGAETFLDYEVMLEDTSLDAVVVTTPNRFHEPATTAALSRDVHVLCEKPLAHTVESAERIVRADAESDAFCMVGFCNRFSAATQLFRQQQSAGTFGGIEHIDANYVRRRGIPGLGSWFTDAHLAGGGALMDLGVHAIDLALYLAGYPSVVEVNGHTHDTIGQSDDYADPDGWCQQWDTSEGGFEVDEGSVAYLRCEDGTTITLHVAWATNRRSSKSFVVNGTAAGAEFALDGNTLDILDTSTDPVDRFDDRTVSGDEDHDRYRTEMERFVSGVETGERPRENRIGQALHVQRVIEAVYESDRSNAAVTLDATETRSMLSV